MGPGKIIKAIKRYSEFLITSHVSLEGDALGSELALASLLRKLGKTACIVNASNAPANYSFLPGIKDICPKSGLRRHQAVIIVDCSDKQRIGSLEYLIDEEKPIINIDHHIDNKNFGKINWVDPTASSTAEMIYHLFKFARIKLDKKDALNIYTAILTDTGSFRHPNTTDTTLYICSELLKFGIKPADIYAKIYENNSVEDVIRLTKILSNMSFTANDRIACITVNEPDFKKLKDKAELLDRLLDFARSIKTVKVVLLFSQVNRRLIKLSMRSRPPINVQKIASYFAGGGHKFASGCTIKDTLEQAQAAVLKQVKKIL